MSIIHKTFATICLLVEIYDIVMESEQFECNGFNLNPVLRMAIMRKVICSCWFGFVVAFQVIGNLNTNAHV